MGEKITKEECEKITKDLRTGGAALAFLLVFVALFLLPILLIK